MSLSDVSESNFPILVQLRSNVLEIHGNFSDNFIQEQSEPGRSLIAAAERLLFFGGIIYHDDILDQVETTNLNLIEPIKSIRRAALLHFLWTRTQLSPTLPKEIYLGFVLPLKFGANS